MPTQRALCGRGGAHDQRRPASRPDQPRAISRSAMRARCPRPISTTIVTLSGASWSRIGRVGRLVVAGDDQKARRQPAVGDGDARQRGGRHRRRQARDDLERDPGARQRQRFLAAAPEHEGVAALEPHDAQPAARVPDQQPVEDVLRDRLPAGALADEEPARVRRVDAHLFGRERVVEDQVGLGQPPRAAHRDQVGAARPGADQRDATDGGCRAVIPRPSRVTRGVEAVQRLQQHRPALRPSACRPTARRPAAAAPRRSSRTGRRARAASSPSRTSPASAGARPSVDTATVTPPRRNIPAPYALAADGSSTAST